MVRPLFTPIDHATGAAAATLTAWIRESVTSSVSLPIASARGLAAEGPGGVRTRHRGSAIRPGHPGGSGGLVTPPS